MRFKEDMLITEPIQAAILTHSCAVFALDDTFYVRGAGDYMWVLEPEILDDDTGRHGLRVHKAHLSHFEHMAKVMDGGYSEMLKELDNERD